MLKNSDMGEKVSRPAGFCKYRVIHHTDIILQKFNWERIAKACGSTPGAVSKRYSRLKLSIERGDAPPSAAADPASKKTPTKGKAKAEAADGGLQPATPKRKRGSKIVNGTDSGGDEDGMEVKRAKATPKSKSRPKTAFRASDKKKASVKSEPEEEAEDVFTDAHEHLVKAESSKAESDLEEVCKSCISLLPRCTLSSAIVLVTPILSSIFSEASVF